MRLALIAALIAAGCARAFTPPPQSPPPPPPEPLSRVIVDDSGEIRAEEDPFSARALRRADHDLQATMIAPDVSLVVEPAANAPIYVSNMLSAALVRRFAGHMPVEDALAAPVVFLIRPMIAADAATINGKLVVDWALRTERGKPVGAVYAARRLSGAVSNGDPWTAVTPEDAEFIAFQAAANLKETTAIREAIARAAVDARVALTPTPAPRPVTVTKQGSQPAPRFAPKPRAKP